MPEEKQHRRRGAGRHEDLIRRNRHAVGSRVVLGDRFAERQDPETVRVPGPAVLDRALQGVPDDRGRLEVRLAELEVHDIDAGALELLGPLGHFDRQEGFDVPDSSSECHERPLTRDRAFRICQSIPGPCRKNPTLLSA